MTRIGLKCGVRVAVDTARTGENGQKETALYVASDRTPSAGSVLLVTSQEDALEVIDAIQMLLPQLPNQSDSTGDTSPTNTPGSAPLSVAP